MSTNFFTMKRILLGLSVIALISLASCSKEKDCKCTTTTTSDLIEGATIVESDVHIEDGKCSDLNSENSMLGVKVEVKWK